MEEINRPFTVRTPITIIGLGALNRLGNLVREFNADRVLIVTDKSVIGAGLLDPVKHSLEQSAINFSIFDNCEPDAPLHVVEECATAAKEGAFDILLAVGGGSVIDTAKAAGILAATDESITNFWGIDRVKKAGLPKILIPTTAGSGSEWTGGIVIADGTDGKKKVIISRHAWGEAVIIDPAMTLNLPSRVTADTGMDALSHAIEAYASWKANILSDMYAEKTIQLVAQNLRVAYAKGPKHIESRYKMAIAAALSAQAVMTASAGAVHSMSYPVAMKAHVTHGAAICIMLPHVMEYNILGSVSKYARIAELMGENVVGLSEVERAQKSVQAVHKLSQDVGMVQRLGDVGIKRDDISVFVDYLFEYQVYGLENNPRDITRDAASEIYESAF